MGYSDIAARMRKAWDQTDFDRISSDEKYDRDCLRCRLGRERSRRARSYYNNGHAAANQILSQFGQPVIVTVGPTVFDCYIAAFGEPGFGRALLKYGDIIVHRFG